MFFDLGRCDTNAGCPKKIEYDPLDKNGHDP